MRKRRRAEVSVEWAVWNPSRLAGEDGVTAFVGRGGALARRVARGVAWWSESGGGWRIAGAAEGSESRGDRGRLGDDGADEEAAPAG